jgi:hypothetical protein
MPDLALNRRDLVADAAAALMRAGIAEPRREALRLWAEIAPGGVSGSARSVRSTATVPLSTALVARASVKNGP